MRDDTKGGPDEKRRTVLKMLTAAGVVGGGSVAASGSAAAQKSQGGGFQKLTFDVEKSGTIVDETDVVDNEKFPVGEDATFDGQLVLTELDVNENDELVASGRLKGTLGGNPRQNVNQRFQNVVLGLLEEVLDVLTPDSAGECPVLTLDVGAIFLDLLGLQITVSEIEIDIVAVAGPGNLLGNLLCAVAGLLDP